MPLPAKNVFSVWSALPAILPLAWVLLSVTGSHAQVTERALNNAQLYFSKIEVAVIAGETHPDSARLIYAEGFRVGGYQAIPPLSPLPSHADSWAPITVTKANHAVVNEGTLELFNKAEPPKPPFPLIVGSLGIPQRHNCDR